MSKKIVTLIAAVCMTLGAWSSTAMADKAECTVFEIKAKTGTAGFDAELKPLEKKLKKPPFSAWNEFKLVKKHTVKAELMKPFSIGLSGGGKLGLLYKERSDAKGRKPRLRIAMTLDNAQGKRKADVTYKVDSGDFNLVGQDSAKDGSSNILAIRCTVK